MDLCFSHNIGSNYLFMEIKEQKIYCKSTILQFKKSLWKEKRNKVKEAYLMLINGINFSIRLPNGKESLSWHTP